MLPLPAPLYFPGFVVDGMMSSAVAHQVGPAAYHSEACSAAIQRETKKINQQCAPLYCLCACALCGSPPVPRVCAYKVPWFPGHTSLAGNFHLGTNLAKDGKS